MRTLKFREILHGVAYKLGLDPDQGNFLTNQAIPIGTYIDQWVRRTYDARDWPELVATNQFTPVNHVVPWSAVATITSSERVIGRVLKVFLIDPATTDAPVSTDFTLMNDGIHVGYEHGTNVWIRYMTVPPRFTAVQWDAATTYNKDDVVYSYVTGECHKSKINGNKNHDPSPLATDSVGTLETTQTAQPGNPGIPGTNNIVSVVLIRLDPAPIDDPPLTGQEFVIKVYNTIGLIASANVIANGTTDTRQTILGDLLATLIADPDLATFTITNDVSNLKMTFEDASYFFVTGSYWPNTSPTPPSADLIVTQLQSYIPEVPATDGIPQQVELTLSESDVFDGAVYAVTFWDSFGIPHSAEYTATVSDSANQVLAGIAAAIQTGGVTDTTLAAVVTSIDTATNIITFATIQALGVNVEITLAGNSFWDPVSFPRVLSEQVMRGAYADLLKEWGQTDKAASEEQAVPAETQVSEAEFDTTPNPALTGQQRALSRYRL